MSEHNPAKTLSKMTTAPINDTNAGAPLVVGVFSIWDPPRGTRHRFHQQTSQRYGFGAPAGKRIESRPAKFKVCAFFWYNADWHSRFIEANKHNQIPKFILEIL
eukprot:5414412-Amphidinium_carterae.1